jgi:flavin reductase (DIM6/NTAB) family NADH-FMN oxidoreductase RutF
MGGPSARSDPVAAPASFGPREFRTALGRFATGVTVITTEHGGRPHGMTANAFVSVSLQPPLVLVSVDHRARMHRLLSLTRRYGVSILAEHQEAVSNHFAGHEVEGLHVSFVRRHRMPVLEDAVARLVASVVTARTAGDHTLYVGRVEYLDWSDRRPLLFYAGQYHELKGRPTMPSPWPEDELALFSIGPFEPHDPSRRQRRDQT